MEAIGTKQPSAPGDPAARSPAVAPREGETAEIPAANTRDARGRRLLAGIGMRTFLSFVVVWAISTALLLVFVRQVLRVRLDEEIVAGLEQEQREFRRLVGGIDPRTGQPFGSDFRAVFDVFFDRNVPNEGEEIIAILGNDVYRSRRAHDAIPLDEQADVITRWSGITQSEVGEVEVRGETARYLAIPLLRQGVPRAVFVVANFPSFEQAEIDSAIRVAMVVSGGVLVIAALLAWTASGRIVRPLRLLTATSRSITESDFSRRIPVQGRDEVAQLAVTFNEMLDRLEEAFSTQRRFVDDAGHELRTPITIIRGHLELLEDDPEQRQETVALVMDELDRMHRIVDDLLTLAKSERPDFLDLAPVDVGSLTREIEAKASAMASRRWEIENVGQGRVIADRHRLTQGVLQVVQNAVRHTGDGQTIALGSLVANGEARFWVRDEGPGIPEDQQDRIFERFARGGAGGRTSEGAGLGLAIVRAIAEAHYGRVEVSSRPGAGARFTIVVPVDQPLPPDER